MHPSLSASTGVQHHSLVSRVESGALADEIRQVFASHSSSDPRVQQKKKDLGKRINRAPETIADFLCDAHNAEKPITDGFVSTILGFFSAHTRKLQRKLCELMQLETQGEGELNNIQMRVAQGDLSRPALVELRKKAVENKAILEEMIAAIDRELYGK